MQIPDEWYTLVRPFSFGIHDITRQRGGVTILNNVINSEKRERVFIDYTLRSAGRVTIQVFTLDGNLVYAIKRNVMEGAGSYRVSWDGANQGGRPVARGMYFIRVVAPDIDEIRKVMVIK
jgi:flagellar hook assembly protein FlgD